MLFNGQPEALIFKNTGTDVSEYAAIQTILTNMGFSVGTTDADSQIDLSDLYYKGMDLLVIVAGSTTETFESFKNAGGCTTPIIGTGAQPELWMNQVGETPIASFGFASDYTEDLYYQFMENKNIRHQVVKGFPPIFEALTISDAVGTTAGECFYAFQGTSLSGVDSDCGVVSSKLDLVGDWENKYDANELPEDATPAWTVNETGTVTQTVSSGIWNARVEDSAGELEYYINNTDFTLQNGYRVKMRMKFDAAFDSLLLSMVMHSNTAPDTRNGITFYNAKIRVSYGATYYEHAMDTTDDYHIYEIVVVGLNVKYYVDDVLILSADSFLSATAWDRLYFLVDLSGDGQYVETWIDYIYWNYTGKPLPVAGDEKNLLVLAEQGAITE